MWSKQTMAEDLSVYFDYIENVLGVKQIYLDAADQPVIEADLLVLVQNLNSMSEAERDLTDKMIASMKIDLNLIKVLDESDSKNKNINARFILTLLNTQQLPPVSAGDRQVTYSAGVLIKQTQLKKEAWAHLQKVIAFYKSE